MHIFKEALVETTSLRAEQESIRQSEQATQGLDACMDDIMHAEAWAPTA